MPGSQHGHHARLGAGAVAPSWGEEPSLWCRLSSAGGQGEGHSSGGAWACNPGPTWGQQGGSGWPGEGCRQAKRLPPDLSALAQPIQQQPGWRGPVKSSVSGHPPPTS